MANGTTQFHLPVSIPDIVISLRALNEGFHIFPQDSGVSLNMDRYKIALFKPSDPGTAERQDRRMRELDFVKFSTGDGTSIIFYTRPLKEGTL